MFWVYDHSKYFNSFSAGIVCIRQNLTTTDIRFCHVKTLPALKGLICVPLLSDPQLQVRENDLYLFNLSLTKYGCFL